MKITAVIAILALLLSCTPKPAYNKMVETTYNFNKSAVSLIISSDTSKAHYIEVEKKSSIFIFEKNSDFIFKVSKNPSQIEIVDHKGNGSKWIEERGFKITSRKEGDTLIVEYFPTQSTAASILKFGTEYKFFN